VQSTHCLHDVRNDSTLALRSWDRVLHTYQSACNERLIKPHGFRTALHVIPPTFLRPSSCLPIASARPRCEAKCRLLDPPHPFTTTSIYQYSRPCWNNHEDDTPNNPPQLPKAIRVYVGYLQALDAQDAVHVKNLLMGF
jgi:hypothetical protein